MLFRIIFGLLRLLQITTLICIVGMLGYFVNGYASQNLLTPDFILILFIVSVLALVWAICTLFSFHRSRSNAFFVSVVDLLFVGALIAGVYFLGFISRANCTNIQPGDHYDISFGIFGTFQGTHLTVNTNKTCAMLKSSFAFGIINAIIFFATSGLAALHALRLAATGGGHSRRKEVYREEPTYRRGGSTHRSRRNSSHI